MATVGSSRCARKTSSSPTSTPCQAVSIAWRRSSRGAVARADKLIALGVKPLHDHVADDGLRVLGDLHVVDGKVNRHVREPLGLAPRVAQDGVTLHTEMARLLQRPQDVLRVATAREGKQQVSLIGERGQLEAEDFVIPLIIAKASQYGRVLGQRMGANGRAFGLRYRIKKIVGHMRGIAGAAAVAAQEHLASAAPTVAQILGEQDHWRPIKSEQDIAETLGVALEVFRGGFDSGDAERFLHDSIPGAVRGLAATKPLMPITIAQRRASQALPYGLEGWPTLS